MIEPRYKPPLKRRIEDYWRAKRRALALARRNADRPEVAVSRKPIPSNSEPWLPHPAKDIAELIWVMNEMEKHAKAWKIELKSSSTI